MDLHLDDSSAISILSTFSIFFVISMIGLSQRAGREGMVPS